MTINEIQLILAQNNYTLSDWYRSVAYNPSSSYRSFRTISDNSKEFNNITVGICMFEVLPENSVTHIEFVAEFGYFGVILDKLASIGIGDEYADIDGNIAFEGETIRILAEPRDYSAVVFFKQNDAQCKKLYDEAVARSEAKKVESNRQFEEMKRQRALEQARKAQ